jgi:hypothetical protein
VSPTSLSRALAADNRIGTLALADPRWHWLLIVCLGLLPALAAAQEARYESARITNLRQEALAYEFGNGVPRDGARAAGLYCEAARLGDGMSQFSLGWMYAHGHGVDRDDALASFFFHAAAARGVEQAKNMLPLMGEPTSESPQCMHEPTTLKLSPSPILPVQVAAPPEPVRAATVVLAPKPILDLVRKIAPVYRVPLPLVLAIIEAESNFNSTAVSPKNAQGLMQLIPETALRFKVKDAFDPAQNVRGGTAYLRWLLAYFEGDVALVAAAYNAGERTVERYRGVPPYDETRAYVRRILASVGPVAQPFDASVTAPSVHLRQIREQQRTK